MNFNKDKTLVFKPLEKVSLTTIPDPLTWHVIVQPLIPEEKTSGGLYISDTDSEDIKKSHCVGKILKMGPLCFKAEPFDKTKPYQEGDFVFFGRHNGMWFNWNGIDLVLLADDRMSMRVTEESLNTNFDGFPSHYGVYEE